ncbi:glycosyltransferase family 2 protein, partial [Halobacterium sp. KA-6]
LQEPKRDIVWFSEGIIDKKRGETDHLRMGENIFDQNFESVIDNEWISGCSLCCKPEIFYQVGLLDAGYFMRISDVEFSLRVRNAGWKLLTITDSKIYHKESATTGSFGLSYYEARNRWRVISTRDEFSATAKLYYPFWLFKAVTERTLASEYREAIEMIPGFVAGISENETNNIESVE